MQHFNTPDVAIVAYTAGLLDGEGSIWAVENRFHTCITQSEGNDGEQLCRWLREQWGIGSVNCQRKVRDARWWPMWSWNVAAGREVIHYLNAVLPYLRVKQRSAEQALAKLEKYCLTANRRFRWSAGEIEYLRANGHLTDTEIARALKRSRASVRDNREALGL